MINKVHPLILAILINIVLMFLFSQFIMIPINKFSKEMAKNICEAQKIKCEFKD